MVRCRDFHGRDCGQHRVFRGTGGRRLFTGGGDWREHTGQPEVDMRLETLTSPQVRALPVEKFVILAPLGSFEQNGVNLPLTTDTDIVTAVANAVEATLPEQILSLPCLWLG